MRLLCITPTFPYPLTNGVLRHYHLIKELSRQHAITLLSVVDRGFDMAYVAAMAPLYGTRADLSLDEQVPPDPSEGGPSPAQAARSGSARRQAVPRRNGAHPAGVL